MWCGGCYTSDPTLRFHVDLVERDGASGAGDPMERERMQTVWKTKLRNPSDFHVGRKGDHLMTPFECDLCIFRKLRKEDPRVGNPVDDLLLGVIRRMNLDALWSRETSTVVSNSNRVAQSIEISRSLGMTGAFEDEGSYDINDHCGYEVATNVLMLSRRPGKYSTTHTQFGSIRKLRSAYGNQVRASAASCNRPFVLVDEGGRYKRLVVDKCGSLWFSRFMLGVEKRMGRIWKPNKALSVSQILIMLNKANDRFLSAVDGNERNLWFCFLIYAAISYVLSLRGTEGFMIDLESTGRLRNKNDGTYFIVGLMGRIKGESNDRCHLLPCINITGSGINVKHVVTRHLELKASQSLTFGSAISNVKGEILNSNAIDELMQELLEEMYEENQDSFPAEVETKEKIVEFYHCYRTFCQSSNTQALNVGVDRDDIDIINRWEKKEKSGGRTNFGGMKQQYAEFELLIQPFLRYGGKM